MNKIIEIDKGIACRVGNKIYINKELRKYPELRKAILDHENNHTEGFTMRDVLIDLEIKELNGLKREYYKFVLRNPKSWIEFLPIKKYGDTVLFNFPIALLWLVIGGIICVVLYGIL